MKELLATWIIFQLFTIGWAMASIHNQIVDGTYKCVDKNKKISRLSGAIFSLALFIPTDAMSELNKYCHLE